MLQSDRNSSSLGNEDESDLQELQSEEEMTPTTCSSVEDKTVLSKRRIKKIGRLLDSLVDFNCELIADELLSEFNSLDKIKVIIGIMFEKAISGENPSTYAKLFKCMRARSRTEMIEEVNLQFFRKTFLRMCQNEFEKDKSKEFGIEKTLFQIVKEISEEKKTALRIQLVNNLEMLRKRSLGVCRFIGELYVIGELNTAIIKVCIQCLLESAIEQDLECLCILMKVIGKVLEEKTASEKYGIEEYFCKMDDIMNKRKSSADLTIMWKEVVLLKNNGWIPIGEPTTESGSNNIKLEEKNVNVQSNDLTMDECSLPRNDSTSVPLVEEKENKLAAETIGDEESLPSNASSSFRISAITYEEGQWSPVNPHGKKKYGSEFLCMLMHSPLSLKDPNLTVKADCVIPYNLEKILARNDRKSSLPQPFLKANADLKRDFSQDGQVILDWKEYLAGVGRILEEILEPEDEESKNLRKVTEKIVGSLQSNNAEEVALEIMKLQIINKNQLTVVVNAIFEQAIVDEHIAETFAGLSLYLNNANFGWQAMKDGDPSDNFKKSLLEEFQKEFQKYASQGIITKFNVHQKLRIRSIASFFAYLYKVGMITDPVLVMFIKYLLIRGDEYSLEILIKIMSLRKPFQ